MHFQHSIQEHPIPSVQETSALWSQRADYTSAHAQAQSQRVEGTAKWVLDKFDFQSWVSGYKADNVLYCLGGPGSGKTILAFVNPVKEIRLVLSTNAGLCRSAVIDHLKTTCNETDLNLSVSYFYFSDKVPTSILGVALALLEQLYLQSPTLASEVVGLESRAAMSNKITLREVIPVLVSLSHRFRASYIVLDALDECTNEQVDNLSLLLSTLTDSGCRLLLFSRLMPVLSDLLLYPQIKACPTKTDLEAFALCIISRETRFRSMAGESMVQEIIKLLSKQGCKQET